MQRRQRTDKERRNRRAAATTRTDFVERVYAVVRQIPPGRVTTYGRIARAIGAARSARMVGWALHRCPPDVSDVAHRVVNRNGELTGGWAWGHPAIMRALLEDEGVTFVDEYQVDLARHLWDPMEAVDAPDTLDAPDP
ncbi:MGMT family protein [Sphaerobacter sp.]|uniref:MGMT family protein n=1 Tax=Sphaerobacter sp. TaxID=2099654 RepID=UPI001D934A58|nr:MGMT family protein [Sphaerobacter sp.]MBX5444274.1 MGMT family protein [Sphaerobacter sp.]